jgi:uncharacterized protein
MNLDPMLLEVLACPCEHHAPVAPDSPDLATAQALVCSRCRTTFPVRDDIPVMLLSDATPGPRGVGAALEPS